MFSLTAADLNEKSPGICSRQRNDWNNFLCVNAHHHHLFLSSIHKITRKQKQPVSTFNSRDCKTQDQVGARNQAEKYWIVGNEKQKFVHSLEDYFKLSVFISLLSTLHKHKQYLFVDWNHAFMLKIILCYYCWCWIVFKARKENQKKNYRKQKPEKWFFFSLRDRFS